MSVDSERLDSVPEHLLSVKANCLLPILYEARIALTFTLGHLISMFPPRSEENMLKPKPVRLYPAEFYGPALD